MSRSLFTGYTVEVKGLDDLINWLKTADPKMLRAMKKGLKESTQPVLKKARANADAIRDAGTYRDSLSIASRKSGAEYILKTDDPAAGVKEFAHLGAYYRTGKYANRRKVGVPRRANPPRVMVPAVQDSADEVRRRIDECLAEVLKEVEHGQG